MNKKMMLTLTIIMLVSVFLSFYSLPYYVQKPGSAFALDDIVEVADGTESEGDFSLMTVSQVKANVFAYAWAYFSDYQEIFPVEQVRNPHESEDEYSVRQLYLMDNSAANAIEVAFREAGAEFEYIYNGIYILNVFPGMPADDILQAGDRIKQVDEIELESSEQFIDYVSEMEAGDTVTLVYDREGEERTDEITLETFPENDNQVGMGISLVDDIELETNPEVEIDSGDIGGPSAGLMYALEIYDQLVEEDLTSGKMVAGTGTISSQGIVGRIGGIEQKVVAADRQGIEVFFAPDDELPESALENNPDLQTNYEAAVQTAESIGTDMEIVPVKEFEDALEYLNSL
ncbi:SepM family pheromone-processing serine protease [Jeotgalibacillus haloalkalitolerans]|uniref:endopeptidase La n=1 Tax=Jeotgalibacillus haloalkalitolerans TaxID=3104292 RepID=A0ABU5KJX2_9BACL|nr:SepM family pheromone-processing serine protease [Jeotgalibacillus sp. HH7-29]MDZ5711548.1 SepM family pheromone-processing serine protease [Jeotgalibacillus sp. HH7-29]